MTGLCSLILRPVISSSYAIHNSIGQTRYRLLCPANAYIIPICQRQMMLNIIQGCSGALYEIIRKKFFSDKSIKSTCFDMNLSNTGLTLTVKACTEELMSSSVEP